MWCSRQMHLLVQMQIVALVCQARAASPGARTWVWHRRAYDAGGVYLDAVEWRARADYGS